MDLMDSMEIDERHPLEANDSWELHVQRTGMSLYGSDTDVDNAKDGNINQPTHNQRRLKHVFKSKEAERKYHRKKRKQHLEDLYSNPGIQQDTMHGMMIDAGSGGSRMHVYEFKPRVLQGKREIEAAVSGKKLSYPGTVSRWTERLKPGISSFATLPDDQLMDAVVEYLKPLMDFATTILRSKNESFPEYPIYLKGTAGLRTLEPHNRSRIMRVIRSYFKNQQHSQFMFKDEFARVISGEEEAAYGWTGLNFAMGSLLQSSRGSGTVIDPKLTYGTLELGGASAQIAFYQSNEDIMGNLFKLQIGQGKHWNIYTHSYLYYGVNESWNRMGAFLATGGSTSSGGMSILSNAHNPCLAGGSAMDFESQIYFVDGYESHETNANSYSSEIGVNQPYHSILENKEANGNYEQCAAVARSLLNERYNKWCDFAHQGDCSFSGVYQPTLPKNLTRSYGGFLAFSQFHAVFKFLNIPDTSSLQILQNATSNLCSMGKDELEIFNDNRMIEEDALKMCFRASFALEMLRGFGFAMNDQITAINVVNGHKIGWALGSILYEINTLPWTYVPKKWHEEVITDPMGIAAFIGIMISSILLGVFSIFAIRSNHHRKKGYSKLDDVQMVTSYS